MGSISSSGKRILLSTHTKNNVLLTLLMVTLIGIILNFIFDTLLYVIVPVAYILLSSILLSSALGGV